MLTRALPRGNSPRLTLFFQRQKRKKSGLIKISIEEFGGDVMHLSRLGEVGVIKECVPQAFPNVEFSLDIERPEPRVHMDYRAQRLIARRADQQGWRKPGKCLRTTRGEDQRVGGISVPEIRMIVGCAQRMTANGRRVMTGIAFVPV